MRDYFCVNNAVRATLLGGVVTLMALPRIVQAGGPVALRAVACLVCMSLVAGAVTAWGKRAGMPGPFPPRAETLQGLGVAVVSGSRHHVREKD